MTATTERLQAGIGRRDMLRLAGGALCSCCAGLSFPRRAAAKDIVYCISGLTADDGNYGTALQKYADEAIRNALGQDSFFMERFFKVSGRIFIKDIETGAYASVPSDLDLVSKRSQGRIIIGKELLAQGEKKPLQRLTAVLAHETAHIFQMATATDARLLNACGYPIKMIELHADYLAGSYMAWRGQSRPVAPADLANLFFELGDRDTASQLHHGTEKERREAFKQGYLDSEGLFRGGNLDVEYAASKGILFVRSLC